MLETDWLGKIAEFGMFGLFGLSCGAHRRASEGETVSIERDVPTSDEPPPAAPRTRCGAAESVRCGIDGRWLGGLLSCTVLIIFLTVVDPRACGGGRGHADPRSPCARVCLLLQPILYATALLACRECTI